MGITPLSTAISTRGKSVDGKTDTGMVKARYAPSSPSVRMRKMTGLECWAIQCWVIQCWPESWSPECGSSARPAFGEFTPMLRSGYFSLDPSLGALDPSLAAFDPSADPSAGASEASILILVLSGRP